MSATDPDGDSLSYQLLNPPAGMQIDKSGSITWNPTSAQIGDYQIQIRVSDSNLTATQNYQLQVTDVPINRTPTISTRY